MTNPKKDANPSVTVQMMHVISKTKALSVQNLRQTEQLIATLITDSVVIILITDLPKYVTILCSEKIRTFKQRFHFIYIDYEFVHDGHCNGGYIADSIGLSLKGCRDSCSELLEAGYFSYAPFGQFCSCYLTAGGCPDDNLYPEYDSYSIIRPGNF